MRPLGGEARVSREAARTQSLKETDTGTIWCTQCGAHGTRQLLSLNKECRGRRAITVSGRRALQRLEAGTHPDTKAVVGASTWVVEPPQGAAGARGGNRRAAAQELPGV